MVTVRVLTPDNWPIWRDLRLRALAEAPYAFSSSLADWQGNGDQEARWRERLGITGSHNLVALANAVPVGMATGVPMGDSSAEVISMWVAPEARGRGAGDRLIDGIDGWARSIGVQRLKLSVVQDNEAATSLYRRNGFEFTGELGEVMEDGVRRELIMAKAL